MQKFPNIRTKHSVFSKYSKVVKIFYSAARSFQSFPTLPKILFENLEFPLIKDFHEVPEFSIASGSFSEFSIAVSKLPSIFYRVSKLPRIFCRIPKLPRIFCRVLKLHRIFHRSPNARQNVAKFSVNFPPNAPCRSYQRFSIEDRRLVASQVSSSRH